MSYMNSEYKIQ